MDFCNRNPNMFAMVVLVVLSTVCSRSFKKSDGSQQGNDDSPNLVSIRKAGTHICGGVIISTGWILTAAQCVESDANDYSIDIYKEPRTVAAEKYGETELHVERIIKYKSYEKISESLLQNDIALIEVKPHLHGDEHVITIAERSTDYAGATVKILGWDLIERPLLVLQHKYGKVLSKQECRDGTNDRKGWGNITHDGLLCIAYINSQIDTCQGDSGGPVIFTYDKKSILIGVTYNYTNSCGLYGIEVYTRVSHFRDWIREQTGV